MSDLLCGKAAVGGNYNSTRDTIVKEDFEKLSQEYKEIFNELQNKSVLITGAYGMIASYLAEFLIYIAEKYNLELYFQGRNIQKAEKIFKAYTGKPFVHLLDFDFEKNQMPECIPNYVIHAASPASTKAFVETPVDVIGPNAVGTWNLLNWIKDKAVEKFLFCSSNSVYGEGGIDKCILTESDYGIVDPLNDRSSYIESKRMAEQMCKAFYTQYKIPTSIIRICHTYGPTFDLAHDTRIIPRVIKKICEGQDIEIYKDPNSVVQYTYIADTIAAILIVLLKGRDGEVYNSGGDELVKIDDAIKCMVNSNEQNHIRIIEKDIDNEYNFAKGNGINLIKLSNEKIKGLGWKQLYDQNEGFKRTVKKYIQDYSTSVF